MSVTTDILGGFASKIAVANLGITYNPAGTYTAGQSGIFMKLMPDAPDRVVTLNLVPQSDDASMPFGRAMLQVRGRGAKNQPLDVDDLMDPIFDLLHGTTNLVFGSCTVVQCNRRTSAPMGMDLASKRWERVDQFYLDVDYPPTSIRPIQGSW